MVSFSKLWSNHPNITGEGHLLDTGTYPDQCAVSLYAALQRSGVNISSFHGRMSWEKGKPKYAIRAQEVANWLSQPATLALKTEKYSGNEAFDKIVIAHVPGVVFTGRGEAACLAR